MEMKMVLIDLDALKSIIENLLDEKLRTNLNGSNSDPHHDFLTTQETVAFLHISKPTLNKLRNEGKIKTIHSTDKRVLFRKSDLINYLTTTRK